MVTLAKTENVERVVVKSYRRQKRLTEKFIELSRVDTRKVYQRK